MLCRGDLGLLLLRLEQRAAELAELRCQPVVPSPRTLFTLTAGARRVSQTLTGFKTQVSSLEVHLKMLFQPHVSDTVFLQPSSTQYVKRASVVGSAFTPSAPTA